MDVLADVLSVTRMGTTVVAQAELVPPWGLEIDPIAEAHVHVVQRGSCWLRTTGEPGHMRLGSGDVVLIRTGSMTHWPDVTKYRLADQPGLSLEAAQWLVEGQKAMLLGADNFGVESFPSKDPENFVPVHTYLLAEHGVSMLEAVWLEDLAKDQVYEFLFIASPLKMRGATASPIRPLAISIQRK